MKMRARNVCSYMQILLSTTCIQHTIKGLTTHFERGDIQTDTSMLKRATRERTRAKLALPVRWVTSNTSFCNDGTDRRVYIRIYIHRLY